MSTSVQPSSMSNGEIALVYCRSDIPCAYLIGLQNNVLYLFPGILGQVVCLPCRGGARGGREATASPKFCLAPQWPPQNFPCDVMPLHWNYLKLLKVE